MASLLALTLMLAVHAGGTGIARGDTTLFDGHSIVAQAAPAAARAAVSEPRLETARRGRSATVAQAATDGDARATPQAAATDPASPEAAAVTDDGPALDDAQQRELVLLLDLVREAKFDLPRRALAAQSLLDRAWPAAIEQLVAMLSASEDVPTQRAVARALANHAKAAPIAFVQPLLDLLGHEDADLRADVASALARYRDAELIEAIKGIALDSEAPLARRLGAVGVLACDHSQASAAVLIQLIDATIDRNVRNAAYSALAELTGISEHGDDAARWRQWWSRHRDLDREAWLMVLTGNFARQSAARDRQQRQLQARLTSVYSQLYRAVPQEGRPPLLIAMLSDTVLAIRQEALRLIGQMLTDGQAIPPELRTALVAELDDVAPEMRQNAARLLYALKDEAGADVVAGRLAAGTERHPGVLEAYLQVMSRVPRAAMIDQALLLLGDPSLRAEAAGALAAAARASLLSDAQLETAASTIRQQIEAGALPERQSVALLAFAGHDEDWARITQWLDSSDDSVKEAAARAWAASTRPLDPLAQRAGDPIIGPIVIAAAQQRGSQSATMLALLQHKPKLDQTRQSWERALIAMAGRADHAAVLLLDARLAERGESAALRGQVLSAALDAATAAPAANGAATPVDPRALADLLLARAEVRLAAGDAQAALSDFQRITSRGLTPTQQQQRAFDAGMLKALLMTGDVAKAVVHAKARVAAGNPDGAAPAGSISRDDVLELFFAAAERAGSSGQADRARELLAQIEQLGGSLSDAAQARLQKIRSSLSTPPGASSVASEEPAAVVVAPDATATPTEITPAPREAPTPTP